jgi:hypothetical protein
MLRLRSRAALGLLALILIAGIAGIAGVPAWAQGPAAPTSAPTVDLRQLLAIARGGLTAAAQAATGPLAPGRPAASALWTAIDAMGHALDTVGTTFAAKSPAFFDALGAGSRALAELKAVWSQAGVVNPGVLAGIETLSASYQLLRGSYGWEALRQQQGGPLTADEERRFQALQAAQAALAARLTSLRQQAAQSGDAQAAADLSRLVAQAEGVAQAERSLGAYLAAQLATENLQGEWAGDSLAVQPATKKAWKQAAPLVEDLTTGADVGVVFTTDLSKVDGWAPLEAAVEVPAGVDLGPGVPGGTTAASVDTDGTDGIPGERAVGMGEVVDLGNVGVVGEAADTDGKAKTGTDRNTDGILAEKMAASPAPLAPSPPILSGEDLLAAFALLGHLLG